MPQLGDYFDHPGYLVLLLLLPVIWWLSFRSLGGLGPYRRLIALTLRSLVFTGIVLALAEFQFLRVSDRMTVIYLLDQSESIPRSQRDAMLSYVKAAVNEHRDDYRRDRAGLIVFGRDANIEVPPLDADLPVVGRLESLFDLRTDATNLAAAMKLAQAMFPEDSSRRIVIVTDGNQNVGDADAIARSLAESGVGIDVVPIRIGHRPEIFVERVSLPADIRKGQPFQVRAVVTNLYEPPDGEAGEVPGKIRLTRRAGQSVETLSESPVTLRPGKNVFPFSNEITRPDFYEYDVEFVPDDTEHDVMTQNNRATAFTHVLGAGHVLLIEDWEHPGQFDFLVGRLRDMGIEVTVQSSDRLFNSMAELQRYDSIVLANVPRTSGDDTRVSSFSDQQIDMLVRNTSDSGCGLIMLGGEQSFGAGGWTNTELEKAMPVDFQIHNAKVAPVGALAMVMHASEMASGNFWQKKIGEEALKALGPQDLCGVVHWNSGREEWLWQHPRGLVKVGPNRRKMRALISRMTPGDMPDFDPSLRLAAASFRKCTEAAVKHMIVISDGDPNPASPATVQEFIDQKIKITTVAVGTHGPAGHQELRDLARRTEGKYYVVNNPQALPRIFQREARRVARPLVKEGIVQPQITARHEILQGIDDPVPPVRGFVLTNVKQNQLVEVLMVSPEPANRENATILAAWTYKFGRAAVLTTDAGHRWADNWQQWEGYDKLFSQLVRWSMRPTGDQGNYTVATEEVDGKVRVVVTALDQNDELLNFLNMSASVIAPDMSTRSFDIDQSAPGRYVGEFASDQPGSYFLTIMPGQGRAPIRAGMNVPYSSEYRDRETNTDLLQRLANRQPQGGASGQLIDTDFADFAAGDPDESLHNSFRRDLARAVSSREAWPLLILIASCVFFGDVFVRRVSVDFEWLKPWLNKVAEVVLRREPEPIHDERIERLRQRKRQVEGSLEERRASTRFEVDPDADEISTEMLDNAATRPATPGTQDPGKQSLSPDQQDDEDYTARLLKAKRDALRNKHKQRDQD